MHMNIDETLAVAVEHHRAGRLNDAAAMYQQIIAEHPDNTDALHLLGVVAAQSGRHEFAEATIGRAIAINSNIAEFHNSLGNVLKAQGKIEPALESYRRALGLKNDYADAQRNLSTMLQHKAMDDPAIAPFRESVRLKPDSPQGNYNLGALLAQNGYTEQAIEAYQQAVRLKDDFAEAHNNLALALTEVGQFDRAIEHYLHAIRIKPDWPDPHTSMAMLLLLKGDFRRAWPEYEWRWSVKNAPLPTHNFSQPRWKGEPLNGKIILLFAEQGFGDTIQFIRYAPMVAARGGRVLLVCLPHLIRLFKDFPGVDEVLAPGVLPGFHVQCPLLSLPHIFDTTSETIPTATRYLFPDPVLAEQWKTRIGPTDGRRKIGLAWAGRATHTHDRQRTISLAQLAPLARHPAVTFYNLQKPEPHQPAIQSPAGMELIDLSSHFDDFAETAALISHLDLVITVDTAIAHLAGAMGKRVWVLLPFVPDWRWMLNRETSPWYPSMRLFRQKYPGDWAGVIERVAREL